jgi:hypothetical protein
VASLCQLRHGVDDCVCAGHVELDADLRHGSISRPLAVPEAGLSGLGQRPDPEGLAPGDRFAVKVAAVLAFKGEPERIDVETSTARWVWGYHGHGGDELDVHGTS